jgi:membrane protease YdiL (CAAX protease family)
MLFGLATRGSFILRFRVNPFYDEREERTRAFWRLLLQLGIYVAGAAVSRLVVWRVWFALYGQADPWAIENPTLWPPLLFLAVQVAVLSVALFSVWFTGRFFDRRPLFGFGLHIIDRQWWLDLGFGLLLGALLMAGIFLTELAAGWVTVTGALETARKGAPFFPVILAPLVGWALLGTYEELVFRGYQLTNMAEGLNLWRLGPRGAILLAVVLSSSLFGVFHVYNPNASAISTVNLALWGGLLLGSSYVLTGRLALPMGLHISWNFFEGNVFGFPVSGVETVGATFLSIEQGGPPLFTGGTFGPEAGVLTNAASVLGCLMILLWVRIRTGRVALQTSLAVPPTAAITNR